MNLSGRVGLDTKICLARNIFDSSPIVKTDSCCLACWLRYRNTTIFPSSLNSKITKSMLCRKRRTSELGGMKAYLHASGEKRSLEVPEKTSVTKDETEDTQTCELRREKKEVEENKSIQEESKCRG